MAHIWTSNNSNQWAVLPLAGDRFLLTGDGLDPVKLDDGEEIDTEAQLVHRQVPNGGDSWLLLAPLRHPAVYVNGDTIAAGLRVLRDRDEIRVGQGERLFFSTETLATVVPFPGLDRAIFCARCKDEITAASPAVRCPQCAVWHHQSEEFPCWTYAEKCALCDQASSLEAGYRWTPEEL